MYLKIVALCCLIGSISAFTMRPMTRLTRFSLKMEEDSKPTPPKSVTLVPIDNKSIKTAGAISSGVLGLVLFGPWGGALLAALANYYVKKEDDAGEAIRGFGKTSLEIYNYLTKINAKFEISEKTGKALTKAVDSIETDSDGLEKLKETLAITSEKVTELDEEYDFVGKGKQVLVAAGALSDAAIEKIKELDDKYDFFGSAKNAIDNAIEKVKE